MTVLAPPLRSPFARVLLVGFVVVHVALAVGPGPTPWQRTGAALVLLAGAAALLVLDGRRVLLRGRAATIVLLAAVGVAVVVLGLPTDGWPGYASWPLGAATFVAVGLALRRRIGAAWALMGLLVAVCLGWSLLGGQGVLPGVGLVERQAGTLLIGTLFAIGLRRAERALDAFHELQRQRSLERDTTEAELRARREAVERVLALAGEPLRRLAAGEHLAPEERAEALAVEGRLRDEIALGPLLTEPLDRAVEAARRRGVDVVLLTDPSVADVSTSTRVRAADWLAARLDRTRGGEFVGRALPRGRGVRVSVHTEERDEHRMLVDED